MTTDQFRRALEWLVTAAIEGDGVPLASALECLCDQGEMLRGLIMTRGLRDCEAAYEQEEIV